MLIKILKETLNILNFNKLYNNKIEQLRDIEV